MTSRDRPDALGARVVVVWALAAVALLALVGLWQRNGYWEYSDGVYALTARLFMRGGDLYGEIAAAQPPPIFLFGAAVLAIDDTPAFLRIAVSAVQLATSALVLVAAWRLTRSRTGALVAALAMLVAPWTLREHAQLIPETFAAPLLLAAALAAARAQAPRAALLAGALAALATSFKLAFALPALVLLLAGTPAGASRIRALLAFAGTGALLAIASLAAFGEPLLDGAVRAQQQTGLAGLGYVGGLWAQAAWNLLPLLACAALAWPLLRPRFADPALARSLAALSVGALLLLTTLLKSGSYLTVLVVIEPPLLCLAAAGVVAAWRARRASAVRAAAVAGARSAGAGGPGHAAAVGGGSASGAGAAGEGGAPGSGPRWVLPVAAAAIALGMAQVGSLLLAPADPRPFVRPFAASGPGWNLSPDAVDRAIAELRACPADVASGGPPYLAFAADRRIAGDQPDQFILQHAPVLEPLRARIDADVPRCP